VAGGLVERDVDDHHDVGREDFEGVGGVYVEFLQAVLEQREALVGGLGEDGGDDAREERCPGVWGEAAEGVGDGTLEAAVVHGGLWLWLLGILLHVLRVLLLLRGGEGVVRVRRGQLEAVLGALRMLGLLLLLRLLLLHGLNGLD
jgi:hypothetical protein